MHKMLANRTKREGRNECKFDDQDGFDKKCREDSGMKCWRWPQIAMPCFTCWESMENGMVIDHLQAGSRAFSGGGLAWIDSKGLDCSP
jgi:hypothetical protein